MRLLLMPLLIAGCALPTLPETDLQVIGAFLEYYSTHETWGLDSKPTEEIFIDKQTWVISKLHVDLRKHDEEALSDLIESIEIQCDKSYQIPSMTFPNFVVHAVEPPPSLTWGRNTELEDLLKRFPNFIECISFLPPGYNKSGDRALLRFFMRSSVHGDSCWSLLRKNDSGWDVQWCDMSFYQ